MTLGSLFSGIGGFDLGFERAGFEIRWQVEIDAYATRVLATHWPTVRRYGDIRAITALDPVDVVSGGFPCQPHSLAGRQRGSTDARDLWPEFRRIIRLIAPRWIVAENVPGILTTQGGRFFGDILADLAACGYDAEWDCLPASAFGAPHRRDRVWIVAYPHRERFQERRECHCDSATRGDVQSRRHPCRCGADVADTNGERSQERFVFTSVPGRSRCDDEGENASVDSWWAVEPDVGRVADGISARVDRLRALGNSLVPQIAQWIAQRIRDAESQQGDLR